MFLYLNRTEGSVRHAAMWVIATFVLITVPTAVMAQLPAVLTSPPNIVLPNYQGIPVGPFAGLEGGAHVARVDDPAAAWFNPAGLSRATGAQISGSAGLYQYTKLSPKTSENADSAVQHVPNLVGFTLPTQGKLTLGMAILTPVSWTQRTNTETVTSVSGNPERLAYSANSELSRRVVALSAGYDGKKKWRVGGGLTLIYNSLTMAQTISDRIADPTDIRTLLVSSEVRGSDFKIGTVAGIQYDPHPKIRIGGVMRTSGFSVYRSGTGTLDGTQKSGSASLGASFFDPSAEFHYKLPFEAAGAIAYIGGRGEIEADVHGYTSISPYQMLSSPVSQLIYQDDGTGGAPSVVKQPFLGLTSASRSVTNVAVGGRYKLLSDKELRLHFGITSDMSPVAPEDQVFSKVNLLAWTIGLSGKAQKLTYAAGFNYRSGKSDSLAVPNVLSGQPLLTDIHIRTMGGIYSLSYNF
jgi:long-subunit fatty acid transport protein